MTVTLDHPAGATRAREAFAARHAELQEVLDHWTRVLTAAARGGGPVRPVRNLLRFYLTDEVLPHARAEERTLYRAARRDPGNIPLLQALLSEHESLKAMTAGLSEPARAREAAAKAAAIAALFASHAAKEDGLLLPAMESSGTDLTALLAREPLLAGRN